MKKLFLVGLVSALLAGCAVQPRESLSEKWAKQDAERDAIALKGKITDKTDKFSGSREIEWKVGMVDSQLYNRVVPQSFSVGIGKASSIVIHTHSYSPLSCDVTQWLVNGKKFVLKPSISRVIPGLHRSFVQVIIYNPSKSQLKTLSAANSIDIKICNDEYTFTQNELNGLKEVVKRAGLSK